MSVSSENVDRNFIEKCIEMNPCRRMLHEVLLERKDILRSRMNLVALYDTDEQSSEIEEILAQFENPTFPLEEVNTEKDEEWQPLERKYLDGINRIKEDTIMKQIQLDKDMEKALTNSEEVLRNHRDFRPIDEKDFSNIRQSISKRFEHSKNNIRGEAATKILVLRREIEQQGRKRRNFDKNTTDILQNWFHDHRQNPYPSDQEKAELAKQCNIKISQVNNWFGNQRIRTKQQALRMQEDERERAASMANEAQAIQNSLNSSTVASSSNMSTSGLINIPLVNPTMQSMVIPAVQPGLLGNPNAFLHQPHYFTAGGQMSLNDNGNGQQFFTDYETFGLAQSDTESFNQMGYLG